MPQHKSAAKRVRQTETRRERNRGHRSKMRTMVKQLRDAKTKEEAVPLLNSVKAYLDRLATKKVFKKNQVANYKGKLEKHVNTL